MSRGADVTIANLNMLYVRYVERVERELHLPLGPLYVARALEDAGFEVDFRDYQVHEAPDLFHDEAVGGFFADPAPVLFVSCMANLLPFAMLALEQVGRLHPDVVIVLGGVGASGVEERVLELAPSIDAIAVGEGEITSVELLRALQRGRDLSAVAGVVWRDGDRIRTNPPRARIVDLDRIPHPAWHLVDVRRYGGINMVSSRGCPFPCTFCSVAPIWGRTTCRRSPESIVEEMAALHERTGADLFLFQDEFFVSTREEVLARCRAITNAGLDVRWKAFGRIDLTDERVMEAMAEAGCVEIRYGVESGSDAVLARTRKGFTAAQAVDVVSRAVGVFPRVDAFFMWGFPFETMEDFSQTLLHMLSLRGMGVRILPSLLSLLPQTSIYEELKDQVSLEFCPELFPEYMLTGHEVCDAGRVSIAPAHERIFDLVRSHPDVFPGFHHVALETNVLPKYGLLQRFGFYQLEGRHELLGADVEACGAHSPQQ